MTGRFMIELFLNDLLVHCNYVKDKNYVENKRYVRAKMFRLYALPSAFRTASSTVIPV
jgi:hypothetical protein